MMLRYEGEGGSAGGGIERVRARHSTKPRHNGRRGSQRFRSVHFWTTSFDGGGGTG